MRYFLILIVSVLVCSCASNKGDNGHDRDYGLVVFVHAPYPEIAAQNKIEGYCTVNFDIGADGIPTNIRVKKSEPAGYFENACVQSIEKSRFNPKIVDGKKVVAGNITYKIPFELGAGGMPVDLTNSI